MRTEYYVAAQLLQSMHGFASGSKRLYELAETNRSSIVHYARCMGLFDEHPARQTSGDSVEETWKSWIRAERFRRLAWAVYVCLVLVSLLYGTFTNLSCRNSSMMRPL